MIADPTALTAIRVGLLRGLIHTQAALASPDGTRVPVGVLEDNRDLAMKIVWDGIGAGEEPYLVRLASQVDRDRIPAASRGGGLTGVYVGTAFAPLNRLVGALLAFVPVVQADEVYPADLERWIPPQHRASTAALSVFLDDYLVFLTQAGSLRNASLRGFAAAREAQGAKGLPIDAVASLDSLALTRIFELVESTLIARALAAGGGSIAKASETLGMDVPTLRHRISLYEIDPNAAEPQRPHDEAPSECDLVDALFGTTTLWLDRVKARLEKAAIHVALKRAHYDENLAALLLGISPRYLAYKRTAGI